MARENHEAASRFEVLIGASNTGAWEYHQESQLLRCSQEYFSMLGCDRKDYDITGACNLTAAWIDLLHPDDRERAVNHFKDYLKNPVGMYQQMFRLAHQDGHWIWVLSRGQSLRGPQDEL